MKQMQNKRRIWGLCVITAIVAALFITAPVAVFAADNNFRFSVGQVFTTSSESADNLFTYKLRPLAEGNPMPAGATAGAYTFTVSGTRQAEIELVGFAGKGIYRYELSQVVDTEKPGYTYDRRVYTIEVHMNAEFHAEMIVLNKDGTKASAIAFENSYQASPNNPELMVDPPVRKIVSGAPRYNSIFTFTLKAGDASWPMPAGSVGGVKTITIEGAGVKDFGAWSYNRAGTYTYTVSEVNTGERGYVYDTTVYTIKDTVTDMNGQLVLARTITNNANIQVETISFVNEYSVWNMIPKTWDDMDLSLYITLLISAGVGVIILIVAVKKRKRQNEEIDA